MITLYHGSNVAVTSPLVSAGRSNLDFGQGFYLTKLKSQAESWARVIASRKGRNYVPIVSVFRFDIERAKEAGFKYKEFLSYDIAWLDYVVSCRQGNNKQNEYDIVEGGVANDNVIDTVEDYEKGIITAEQALGQLQFKKVNHQICILNQSVIDRFLVFQEIISLTTEDF